MGDQHLTNETESQKDHHDFFHFTLELIMMAIVLKKNAIDFSAQRTNAHIKFQSGFG